MIDGRVLYPITLDEDVDFDDLAEWLEDHGVFLVELDWTATWAIKTSKPRTTVGVYCGKTRITNSDGDIVCYKVSDGEYMVPTVFERPYFPHGTRLLVSNEELGDGANPPE